VRILYCRNKKLDDLLIAVKLLFFMIYCNVIVYSLVFYRKFVL